MSTLKKVLASLAVSGVLAVAVTSPSLPQAISGFNESPTVSRIGVVTKILEADNITVKISGSDVLVQASYLFPQYHPLLGDNVYVVKQDAQWMVLGTISGPINSVVLNPSFEQGALNVTPNDWSITVLSSGGGTPTFTKVSTGQSIVAGLFVADFGVDSAAAGTSDANVFSSTFPTVAGEKWTAAYYIARAFVDANAVTFASNGRNSFIELRIQFLNAAATVIQDDLINVMDANTDIHAPNYRRPAAGVLPSEAPAGATGVRIRFYGFFDMSATSFTSFFIDYVVLRKVT